MNQSKTGKFISDKAVSKWETGKSVPDLSLFSPLCKKNVVLKLQNVEKIYNQENQHS